MASLVDGSDSIAVASSAEKDHFLSEADINQLLKEAETRLREAQESRVLAKKDSTTFAGLPKLKSASLAIPYLQEKNGIAQADSARLVDAEQRTLADAIYVPEAKVKKDAKETKETAGGDWYDMPKTDLTPQLKRDLQLIQMRSVLDPHRHYKNPGKGKIPTFSQTGTVVEGPTEYYSARLNKRDRKQNFVEEVMADDKNNGRFKRKYNEIQGTKTSGKKAHYKKLQEQRKRRK